MEQKRDYLDELLLNAFEEIQTDGRFFEGYNDRLLSKLHEEKLKDEKRSSGKIRTAAISLITAGFLMGFMYTSEVQYGITSLQCKIKYDYSIMMHNFNLDKFFLGE
jgi:hypothetical protein